MPKMRLGVASFYALLSVVIVAADPTATCQTGWTWASNQEGQNPCLVVGSIDASCRSKQWYNFTALDEGYVYTPPESSDPDSLTCECNTVVYNLVMACTACQNRTVDSWSTWSGKCNVVQVTQFPGDIPIGTGVPQWAYLNTTSGSWNAAEAKAVGDTPESTRPPQQTTSIPPASNTDTSTSSNTSNTAPPSSQGASGKSKTNVGAIAGGVVGGVVVLAVSIGAIVYLCMKRKPPAPPSAAYSNHQSWVPPAPYSPPPSSDPQMKLYNPEDPTSYPANAHIPSMSGETAYTTYGGPLQPQRGYHGVAEL